MDCFASFSGASLVLCSAKKTCDLTAFTVLFFQAGVSCEIHLAVFRQGNQQLCSMYLLLCQCKATTKCYQIRKVSIYIHFPSV